MRLGRGSASWQVSVGDRPVMTGALWLRDASGLAADPDPAIPPLVPAVPVRPDLAALASRQAAAQWTGLWIGLWEGRLDDWWAGRMLQPPGYELLSQSPQLRALTEAGFADAMRWVAEHRPLRPARTRSARAARSARSALEGMPGVAGRSGTAVPTPTPAPVASAADLGIGEVVRELEKQRQRQAGAFHLEVTVLPVTGRVFWLVSEGRLVVSEALAVDRRAFRALMVDVLGAMI